MEIWSVHQLFNEAIPKLGDISSENLKKYAQSLQRNNLPVIFTLRHLSQITGVDYSLLRKTVMRRREMANYRIFRIKKRAGGYRYLHQVSRDLFKVQQFINSEILQKITPHTSSFAFHVNSSIKNCALEHCGARWLFQYDLKDFFYAINERRIYNIFKDNGYRPLLAFELARICTTVRLPEHLLHYTRRAFGKPYFSSYNNHYKFYDNKRNRLGVLPQGAPTSPMLSNLAVFHLDERLTKLADHYGLIYTRYADDITFSSNKDFSSKSLRFCIHRNIIKTIRQLGFHENPKKTRISGPGAKKLVLGLLIDGKQPRISKEAYKRVERLLYASIKYGIINVAKHEKFDTPYGFYNHLSGLLSFIKYVDSQRWEEFNQLFSRLKNPLRRL